jgi:hypothetical protein
MPESTESPATALVELLRNSRREGMTGVFSIEMKIVNEYNAFRQVILRIIHCGS